MTHTNAHRGKAQTRPRGLLITFEGTEGAGKSTLIDTLAARLEREFRTGDSSPRLAITREPGGSAVAEKIRQILLEEPMDPWCELFLYEAARAEHLAKNLRPAIDRGDVVLCDRFTDSSLAYQGHARGLPWKQVQALNRIATRGLKPDLTVLLDVDPAIGLERARERTRFEAEGLEFQQKVREGFLKAKREEPRRWLMIPARTATPEQNAEKVWKEMKKRFPRQLKGTAR